MLQASVSYSPSPMLALFGPFSSLGFAPALVVQAGDYLAAALLEPFLSKWGFMHKAGTGTFCFFAIVVEGFVGCSTQKRDDFLSILAQFCATNQVELSIEIESNPKTQATEQDTKDPLRFSAASPDLSRRGSIIS